MKRLFTIIIMTITTTAMAQNGKAVTEKKTFSRETSVSINIKADPSIVWKLLTTAADFPRWNSTVISVDGKIAVGEKIKLISSLAPKRVFKLKVKEMESNKRLVWGDKYGDRVYTITDKSNGMISVSMSEKIGGFMFPLYSKHIPSFDQSFEQFVADLKKEAETIQSIRK